MNNPENGLVKKIMTFLKPSYSKSAPSMAPSPSEGAEFKRRPSPKGKEKSTRASLLDRLTRRKAAE